jgi:hypothetical protein
MHPSPASCISFQGKRDLEKQGSTSDLAAEVLTRANVPPEAREQLRPTGVAYLLQVGFFFFLSLITSFFLLLEEI